MESRASPIEPPPDYSVVLPAFNEEALLPRALAALRTAMASVPLRGEVIVTDNNSTDRTAAVARAEGAQVVFEPHNQISRARNAGARAARGRYLVFVDADSEISPALLRAALARLTETPCAGGGATVAFDEPVHGTARLLLAAWTLLSRTARLAAGSFVFCRSEAFHAVGGFSEEVYASEEVHFSRAVRRWGRPRGLEFVILPNPPLLTSARKMRWHSPTRLCGVFLLHLLLPGTLRSRRWCAFWYRRPPAGSP